MNCRRFTFSGLLALAMLAAGLLAAPAPLSAQGNVGDPGPLLAPTVVLIPKGSSAKDIARILEEQGAIGSAVVFNLFVRLTGKAPELKAGEYEIPARASAADIIDILSSGRSIDRKITFPEGMTAREIVEKLNATEGLSGQVTSIPLEGSLLPNTYYFTKGQDRAEIIAKMKAAMDSELARLWDERAEGLPLATRDEAVILASIVERETAVTSEAPVVASVYLNRLRQGMRLQADPTVIYGLTDGYGKMDRELLLSDLREPSPYNTYLNAGLPPTAIANPGLAAIHAVLHPVVTNYLFFVADGSGGHVFAETYEEHQENVANWRQIKRDLDAQQRQKQGG